MPATILHPQGVRRIERYGRIRKFGGQEFAELIGVEELYVRTRALGAEIAETYGDADVVLVGVTMGALPFMMDLARAIRHPFRWDLLGAGSYGNGCEQGELTIRNDLRHPIAGTRVVLIEDTVDSGRTMNALLAHLAAKRPSSVHPCALLCKPGLVAVNLTLDHVGFIVPDWAWLVGWGLDGKDYRFRGMPFIGIPVEKLPRHAP